MTSRGWLLWSTVGVAAVAAALGGEHVRAQRGFGFGPPAREKRSVVKQFDADGNGRLNDAERAEARTWLATQPQRGVGFGRRGFGPPPEFAGRFGGQPPFAPPPGGRGGRGFAMATPGPRVSPADVTSAGSAPLYDPETVRTIFIDFRATDWERELADFYDTDVDVPATVTVDGRRYADVGVHFRGMSSFMMVPAGSKRSLNLSFDFADNDQRLLGYRTLNLLNVNGDPSFLRPMLYTEIARRYIPTPRTNYVRVVINGEYLGRVYQRTAVQHRLYARLLREHEGRAVEGSGLARRTRRARVSRRQRRRLPADLRDQDEGQRGALAGADRALSRPEHDVARGARSGARADARRGRDPEVPGTRSHAGQQRRLLDARQRLQPVSRRARTLSRPAARHQRSARRGSRAGPGRARIRRRRWRQSRSIRWSASTTPASRYARNCSPCRRYARGISPTCARSRRTGSTGARSGCWRPSIARSSRKTSTLTRKSSTPPTLSKLRAEAATRA